MDTQEVKENQSIVDDQFIYRLEQRILQLERAAHTEHTLSTETINQIIDAAVQKMQAHLHKLMGLGKSLLQEEKAQ